MQVQSLGQEDPLEKEMATYSSILDWKIPWTEEPGGLQSMIINNNKRGMWGHEGGMMDSETFPSSID